MGNYGVIVEGLCWRKQKLFRMVNSKSESWFLTGFFGLVTVIVLAISTSFIFADPIFYSTLEQQETDFCQGLRKQEFEEMMLKASKGSQYIDSVMVSSDVFLTIGICEFGAASSRDSQLYDSLCLQWKYTMHRGYKWLG